MEISVKGEAKEIADLVLAIQDQQNQKALETAAEELFQSAQSGDLGSIKAVQVLVNTENEA